MMMTLDTKMKPEIGVNLTTVLVAIIFLIFAYFFGKFVLAMNRMFLGC